MTKFFNIHAVLGPAALISFLSFGSAAEAASVLNCKGDNASKVTACCEQAVGERGKPAWMSMARTNCRKVTVCTAKGCYIEAVYKLGGESRGGSSGK